MRKVNTSLSGPGFQSACQVHHIIHAIRNKQVNDSLRVIASPAHHTHCWMQAVISCVNCCISHLLPHLLYMLVKCLRLALAEGKVCRSCACETPRSDFRPQFQAMSATKIFSPVVWTTATENFQQIPDKDTSRIAYLVCVQC